MLLIDNQLYSIVGDFSRIYEGLNNTINDLDAYHKDEIYNKIEADEKFQEKGEYLTEQSLSGYVTIEAYNELLARVTALEDLVHS